MVDAAGSGMSGKNQIFDFNNCSLQSLHLLLQPVQPLICTCDLMVNAGGLMVNVVIQSAYARVEEFLHCTGVAIGNA